MKDLPILKVRRERFPTNQPGARWDATKRILATLWVLVSWPFDGGRRLQKWLDKHQPDIDIHNPNQD